MASHSLVGSWARMAAFVYVSALIVVCFSERVFWFWTPGIVAHLEGALFYSLPMSVVVWSMASYRVGTGWGLLAVAPLYAYVTEGVITPVIYSGGPFVPFFPAWFAAWHGIGAVVVCWYLVRRWLLDEDRAKLALFAVGLGSFWGVWASTSRLPEQMDDPEMVEDIGALNLLGPADFSMYASMVTAVLIVSHLALGRLWPSDLRAGRRTGWVLAVLCLIAAIAWTFVLPWALPMFAFYVWLQVRVLRRHRRGRVGSPLLEQAHGTVRVVSLSPLLMIAPTAAGAYALLWELNPGDTVLRWIYYGTIVVQALVGAVLVVVSWSRTTGPTVRTKHASSLRRWA